MRIKAWGNLTLLSMVLVVSACSHNNHLVKADDDDEDLLFGNITSSAKKKSAAHVPVAGSMKRPATASSVFVAPSNQSLPRPAVMARPAALPTPRISGRELQLIADRIFQNEGGGQITNLVHWNDGENFASMGIGHFTWYPSGRKASFGNTFPGLLDHLQSSGVRLPAWLQQARHQGAPWRSKAELMYAKNSGRVRELQDLLYQTRMLQAAYIVQRTQKALPKLVQATTPQLRGKVSANLNALANTPGGWYALIDYVNFKGEGLNRNGGYRGQNWGLLQVLEEMQISQPGAQALHEFANAANRVLTRRVRNSPPGRNEARWLAGWAKRINTYRYPGV